MSRELTVVYIFHINSFIFDFRIAVYSQFICFSFYQHHQIIKMKNIWYWMNYSNDVADEKIEKRKKSVSNFIDVSIFKKINNHYRIKTKIIDFNNRWLYSFIRDFFFLRCHLSSSIYHFSIHFFSFSTLYLSMLSSAEKMFFLLKKNRFILRIQKSNELNVWNIINM